MSTVKANLLQNVTGTDAPIVTKGSFIRAFAPIQAATTGVPATFGTSLNLASLLDTGVGQYQFNFTALFLDTPAPVFTATSTLHYNPGWSASNVQAATQTLAAAFVDVYSGLVAAGPLA
jgi:hypothetical protein